MASKSKKKETLPEWILTVNNGWCTYRYRINPETGNVSIWDVYQKVRKMLKDPVEKEGVKIRRKTSRFQLTPLQEKVIKAMGPGSGNTAVDIANSLKLKTITVAGILSGLQKKGRVGSYSRGSDRWATKYWFVKDA